MSATPSIARDQQDQNIENRKRDAEVRQTVHPEYPGGEAECGKLSQAS